MGILRHIVRLEHGRNHAFLPADDESVSMRPGGGAAATPGRPGHCRRKGSRRGCHGR